MAIWKIEGEIESLSSSSVTKDYLEFGSVRIGGTLLDNAVVTTDLQHRVERGELGTWYFVRVAPLIGKTRNILVGVQKPGRMIDAGSERVAGNLTAQAIRLALISVLCLFAFLLIVTIPIALFAMVEAFRIFSAAGEVKGFYNTCGGDREERTAA